MSVASLFAGSVILCFSFLGFDAVTTYAEETAEPKKTIPRSIYWVAMIGGGIFTTTAVQFINFGALTAFTAVNVSAFSYYMIHKKMRGKKAVLQYVIVPVLETAFVIFLWTSLED